MSDQPVDFLQSYRQCRAGFFLIAAGLVPLCFLNLIGVVEVLGRVRLTNLLLGANVGDFAAALCCWATLIGSACLWLAWDVPSWRRRAGLLMSMCLVDVVNWSLDLADGRVPGQTAWLRHQFGEALGWAQMALMASLAGDLLAHLGVEAAEDSAKSTRSLAATGALVWMLLFCEITNFQAGWPPQRMPWPSAHAQRLWIGQELIGVICLVQVSALTVAAARHAFRAVEEAEARHAVDDDRFVLSAEPNQHVAELLQEPREGRHA